MDRIERTAADVRVVSLGADTLGDNSASQFTPGCAHFPPIGGRIGRPCLSVAFVTEGGYTGDKIGLSAIEPY